MPVKMAQIIQQRHRTWMIQIERIFMNQCASASSVFYRNPSVFTRSSSINFRQRGAGGAGRMNEGVLPELAGGWVWMRRSIGIIKRKEDALIVEGIMYKKG